MADNPPVPITVAREPAAAPPRTGPAGAAQAPARPGALRSLANPNYRRYWFATGLSMSSQMMQMTARAWLTLELTNSPFLVGLVTAIGSLPMLVFSLLGGVLADRVNRRRLLMFADGGQAACAAVFVILIGLGGVQVWQIMLLAFITGVCFALILPPRQALMPELVPRADLANAIALGAAMLSLGQIAGPGLAGIFIGRLGLGPAFLIAAALILPVEFLYAGVRTLPPRAVVRAGILRNLLEGFAYVRHAPTIAALMLIGVAGTVFGAAYYAFAPVIVRDHLQAGADGLGVVMALSGLGALGSTFIIAQFRESSRWFPLLLVICFGYGGSLALFALVPWFPAALMAALLCGFMFQGFLTSNQTIVQLLVPDELRGRVVSMRVVMFGLSPVGQFLVGAAAERVGTPLAVAASGLLCIVTMTGILLLTPSLRKL
jgi:MFS family permease